MSENVVIVAAARTPVGSFAGSLASLSATALGTAVVAGWARREGSRRDRLLLIGGLLAGLIMNVSEFVLHAIVLGPDGEKLAERWRQAGLVGEPDPSLLGWLVVATFALGVLALLGDRVPLSLRVFLMALAIFDLDNTLLGGDSDHAWGDFIASRNLVDAAQYRARNDAFAEDYASGRLDHQTYFKSIRVDQAFMGQKVLDRVLSAWLWEYALEAGLIDDVTPGQLVAHHLVTERVDVGLDLGAVDVLFLRGDDLALHLAGLGQHPAVGPDDRSQRGVFAVALVVLGEALFEPLDPARVEQIELQIVQLKLGIGGEVQEEGQPQVSGCFSRDIDAIERVAIQGIQQELLGQRIARRGIVNGNVRFEWPAVRKEETEIRSLLTKVDADLQTIVHGRFSSSRTVSQCWRPVGCPGAHWSGSLAANQPSCSVEVLYSLLHCSSTEVGASCESDVCPQ